MIPDCIGYLLGYLTPAQQFACQVSHSDWAFKALDLMTFISSSVETLGNMQPSTTGSHGRASQQKLVAMRPPCHLHLPGRADHISQDLVLD